MHVREFVTRLLRSSALALVFLLAAVVLPTTNVAHLDGMPLSSLLEVPLVLLAATTLLSAGLGCRYGRVLLRRHKVS